jgi:hypothetical protein
VPHVRAENILAAGYALGWLQCEDYGVVTPERLWSTRGQTARVKGRRAVEDDFDALRRRARAIETYHLLEPATREVYEGFALGVNRYIALHRAEFPAHLTADFTGYDAATLHIGAGLHAGNPFRAAIGQSRAAIEAGTHFRAHPRQATASAPQEPAVQLARRFFQHALQHFNTRRAQLRRATAIHARVRVANGVNHARDAGGDEGIRTRRRATMMTARFERDVRRGATRSIPSLAQRKHFGVRFTGACVKATPHHHAIANDDATHARIRCRGIQRAPRLGNGLTHEPGVFGAGSANRGLRKNFLAHLRVLGVMSGNCPVELSPPERSFKRSISSRNASTS